LPSLSTARHQCRYCCQFDSPGCFNGRSRLSHHCPVSASSKHAMLIFLRPSQITLVHTTNALDEVEVLHQGRERPLDAVTGVRNNMARCLPALTVARLQIISSMAYGAPTIMRMLPDFIYFLFCAQTANAVSDISQSRP
jgi:hypothetical protein